MVTTEIYNGADVLYDPKGAHRRTGGHGPAAMMGPQNQSGSAGARRLQNLLVAHPDVQAFLQQLVMFAAERIRTDAANLGHDGPVWCGISLESPDRPVTVARSDEFVDQVDTIQYDLDGPCLYALHNNKSIVVSDVDADTRWPAYREASNDLGVKSVIAIPLPLQDGAQAVMNWYSTSPNAFDDMTIDAGTVLAVQAAQALLLASRMTDRQRAKDLHDVLQSRTVVDLAVGIIMGKSGCDQQTAFAMLRSSSAEGNSDLDDVATDVVASMGLGVPKVHDEGRALG